MTQPKYIATELNDNDSVIAAGDSWSDLAVATAEQIAESGAPRGFEIYATSDGRLVATFASVEEVLI